MFESLFYQKTMYLHYSELAMRNLLARQSTSKNAPFGAFFIGSSQLTGEGHSSDTIDHAVPTAVGEYPQSVVLEIPESKRAPGHHFHFSVEALGDAIRA